MPQRNAATKETEITVSLWPGGKVCVVYIGKIIFSFTPIGIICHPKGATDKMRVEAERISKEVFAAQRYTPHEESPPPRMRPLLRMKRRTRIEFTCPSDD